jgi:transmembrane sensor
MAKEQEFIERSAAAWLARRDRILTPKEQDQFLEWLREDIRHAEAMARLEKTWSRLDTLAQRLPNLSIPTTSEELEQSRKPSRRSLYFLASSCAAAVVFLVVFTHLIGRHSGPSSAAVEYPGIVRWEPERRVLSDGSIVELRAGAKIEAVFEPEIRRVRLLSGEAHFTVAKNPARPFVVETKGVDVRAVGTAFSVQLEAEHVAVLVTEGKVRLDRPPSPGAPALGEPQPAAILAAGQRAMIDTSTFKESPVIAPVSAAEIEQALSWEGLQLEFTDIPLSRVVEEFNQYNRRRLMIADAVTGELRVGGRFRADNVDAFVRLLELSWGIVAVQQSDGTTVLSRK